MKLIVIFLMTFWTSAFSLNADNELVDKSTGETFPKTTAFEYAGKQYQLEATGVSTRRKLIVKVYSIAHYLQKGAIADIQNIMSDANAKQFTIKWVHDVTVEKVQNAFQESFHKVFTPESYEALKNDISRLLQFFNQNANVNDEYILRWIPGGHIEVLINGKERGSVTNKELAIGVWNIWLGPKSVVDSKELLSR